MILPRTQRSRLLQAQVNFCFCVCLCIFLEVVIRSAAQQNWVFSENSRKELISFRIILNMTGQFWLLVSSLRVSKSPARLAHLSSTLKKVVCKFSSLFVVFACLGSEWGPKIAEIASRQAKQTTFFQSAHGTCLYRSFMARVLCYKDEV